MSKKLFLSFIFLCFSFNIFAATAKVEIQNLKRELEIDIQEHLTAALKQRYGLEQVLISAEVILDERSLLSSLGVEENNLNLKGNLPGFASSSSDIQLLRPLSILEGRGFISKLGLNLHAFNKDYDLDELKKFVALLATSYLKIKAEKITIQSDESTFQLIKKKVGEIKPAKKPQSLSDFFYDNWKLFFVSGMSVLGLLVLTFTLRRGFNSMAKMVPQGPGSSLGERRTVATGSVTLSETASEKSMINLLAIRAELEQLGRKHPHEFENLLQLKVELGDTKEALLLLECIESDRRELVLQKLLRIEGVDGDTFLARYSQQLLQNYQNAPAKTADLVRLFKLVLLRPSSMRKIVLLDTLNHFPLSELEHLYGTSATEERLFLQTNLPESSIGQLVARGMQPAASSVTATSEADVIGKLIELIGQQRKTMNQKHEKERFVRIYAHLPFQEAETYAKQMELAPELRLPALYLKYKASGIDFIKSLNFEKMRSLIDALEPEVRADVLKSLPEILAERLEFSRPSVSPELRGEFYFYLYEIHESTASDVHTDVLPLAA